MIKIKVILAVLIATLLLSSSVVFLWNESNHIDEKHLNSNSLAVNPKDVFKVDKTLALDNNTLFNGNLTFPDLFGSNSISYNPNNGYLYAYGNDNIAIINVSQKQVTKTLSVGSGNTIVQMVYASEEKSMYFIDSAGLRSISPSNILSSSYALPGNQPVSISYDNLTNQIIVLLKSSYENQLCLIDVNPITSETSYLKNITMSNAGFGQPYLMFDYLNNRVYVSNSDNITVLNLTTMKLYNITSDDTLFFYSMALDTSSGNIYISNGANLTVLDTSTNKLIGNISGSVSTPDTYVYFNPNNGYVYSMGENHVYVSNNMNTLGKFTVGVGPVSICSIGDKTYTINEDSMNISIDYNMANYGEIFVGAQPDSTAFNPYNGYVYVSNLFSKNIWVINGSTSLITGNINLTFCPQVVTVNTYNGRVYVLGEFNGSEYFGIINNKDLQTVKDLGVSSSTDVHMTLGGPNNVYISDPLYEKIINLSTLNLNIENITIGGSPGSIVFDSFNNYIYVENESNSETYNLTVIGSGEVVKNIPFGGINDLLYDPENHLVYISNDTGIFSIDQKFLVLPVNGTTSKNALFQVYYYSMAYDEENNVLYAASLGYGSSSQDIGYVSSINLTNNSYCSNVYTYGEPVTSILTYDNVSGYLYESHFVSGRISVMSGYQSGFNSTVSSISGKYNITFTESGLPAGTTWFVILNGTKETSTGSNIIFQESNGSYSYTIGKISGYQITPSSGTVNVDGHAKSIDLTFSKQNSVNNQSQTYEIIVIAVIAILIISVVFVYFTKFK
ncbi:YncE family protein [Cuniculiplasma sp. SKW3]|uniref:YncE family protein n=1 Tax=Cuniculiplasma sp. SKW3 TaxID=3400170 RepID=UPI003FD32D61